MGAGCFDTQNFRQQLDRLVLCLATRHTTILRFIKHNKTGQNLLVICDQLGEDDTAYPTLPMLLSHLVRSQKLSSMFNCLHHELQSLSQEQADIKFYTHRKHKSIIDQSHEIIKRSGQNCKN